MWNALQKLVNTDDDAAEAARTPTEEGVLTLYARELGLIFRVPEDAPGEFRVLAPPESVFFRLHRPSIRLVHEGKDDLGELLLAAARPGGAPASPSRMAAAMQAVQLEVITEEHLHEWRQRHGRARVISVDPTRVVAALLRDDALFMLEGFRHTLTSYQGGPISEHFRRARRGEPPAAPVPTEEDGRRRDIMRAIAAELNDHAPAMIPEGRLRGCEALLMLADMYARVDGENVRLEVPRETWLMIMQKVVPSYALPESEAK